MNKDNETQQTTTQVEQQTQQEDVAQQASSDQFASEQQKAEEYLDLLRRTQADFVNYKRRVAQEQAEVRTTEQIAVLNQLLPVLDDLGRALHSAPADLRDLPWVQGVQLVAKRLTTTLEQMGVQQVGKPGEHFDPRWHEAVTMQPRADVPEGTILDVARPGYALRDRVIRPAQVVVAGATAPSGAH